MTMSSLTENFAISPDHNFHYGVPSQRQLGGIYTQLFPDTFTPLHDALPIWSSHFLLDACEILEMQTLEWIRSQVLTKTTLYAWSYGCKTSTRKSQEALMSQS